MQRGLSRRGPVLLGLFHIISLLVVTSTAAAIDANRRWKPRVRRSGAAEPIPGEVTDQDGGQEAAEDAEESCRCAADQWEGVLRSTDREFYVAEEMKDFDQSTRQRLGAAVMESNSAIHYDFRNRLFASQDLDTGVKVIIDYNTVGCADCIHSVINLKQQAGRRQVRSLLTVCDIDIFMFLSIVLYASTYLCNELMSLLLS